MNEFKRNLWCLLGLPIDVVGFEQALEMISAAARDNSPCFFSTPNLNFIIEAGRDAAFRDSVIQSDLVLLDGMPPVWIARLLGIPGIEKVSGSNLFEAMCERRLAPTESVLKVFLFGGEAGIAQRACEAINESSLALQCVGYIDPGFGSVDELSSQDYLDAINAAAADFVLVALGAQKGQAWIMANRAKLRAPVISHLGAVINFTAGNVARAPTWMQNCGLEWAWRTWQEPGLWRRYFGDGLALCGLLASRVLPYRLWHRARIKANARPVEIEVEHGEQLTTIRLGGDCCFETIDGLREVFRQEFDSGRDIDIDLAALDSVDNAFLGLCLLLYKHSQLRDFKLSFSNLRGPIRRAFHLNGVDYLL